MASCSAMEANGRQRGYSAERSAVRGYATATRQLPLSDPNENAKTAKYWRGITKYGPISEA